MQHADWIRRTGPLASLALGLAVAACGTDIAGVSNDVAKTVISGNAAGKSVVEDINPETFRQEVPCPPLGVEPDRYLLMTVGVSGRVTPGPAWPGGEILLPLRISVSDTDAAKAKPQVRQLSIPVTLGAGAPAEQWALVEENVSIPQGGSAKVQIALDEKGKRRQ